MTLPEATTPLSLDVQNLSVSISSDVRLKRVNLRVDAGSTVAIVGPVGSGKSELVWAVNRMLWEVPQTKIEGKVLVAGTDIEQVPLQELRFRVSLLIPAPLARTPFSEVAVALRNVSHTADAGLLVEQALRQVGLWKEIRDRLHRPYNSNDPVLLRLLCLARSLVQLPGLLALDDPTRGLDSVGRARFEDAITNISSTGNTTIVWSTREPDQAGRVASQLAFLCNGEVVETGRTSDLFEHPSDPRTESFLTGDYRRLLSLIQLSTGSGGKTNE